MATAAVVKEGTAWAEEDAAAEVAMDQATTALLVLDLSAHMAMDAVLMVGDVTAEAVTMALPAATSASCAS
jgi:hypothetical protein